MNNVQLRDLQLCELQILKDITRICRKYGFRYYLCGGTLLGAVRHQGFIPWDDDIDIQMPLEDYNRFLEIAQQELGDGYFVQNSETEPLYPLAYTHIRKNGTALLFEEEKQSPSHHGVWVDVFPMIYIRNDRDYRIRRAALKACYYLRLDKETYEANKARYTSHSNRLTVGLISLIRKFPLQKREKMRAWLLRWICKNKTGKYLCYIWSNLSMKIPVAFFGAETVTLPFEDDSFPVPAQYDTYLRQQYGDYMVLPPPEKRNGGHGEYAIIDLEKDWTFYYNS